MPESSIAIHLIEIRVYIVPRDIATREIFDICVNQGLGVAGENQVFLDLTHLDRDYLERKLGGIVEI